jgi:hypothetical protein
MSIVIELEKAIAQLPEDDQRKLAEWFDEQRLLAKSSAVLGSIYDGEDGGEIQLLDA